MKAATPFQDRHKQIEAQESALEIKKVRPLGMFKSPQFVEWSDDHVLMWNILLRRVYFEHTVCPWLVFSHIFMLSLHAMPCFSLLYGVTACG